MFQIDMRLSLLTMITLIVGKSGYEIIKKMLQKTNDNIIMVVKNSTKCIELYGGDLLEYKDRYVCICAIVWCYADKLCQSSFIKQ